MPSVPAITQKRLASAVPKFKKILKQAKEKDVNESDTVTIVTDMLEEIFGFDKYSEITREFSIQGTYCDLAIKTGKTVDYLIEVKAIGRNLKGKHLRQAVNYASREGIRWVILSNGIEWQIHRVTLDTKITSEELCTINFLEVNPKKKEEAELLFLLCKRGIVKDNIDKFYEHRQSFNRYTVGAMLCTEKVASVLRREIRKMNPGLKVSAEAIQSMVQGEVIKREVIDSDSGNDAKKQVAKFYRSQSRAKTRQRKSNQKNVQSAEENELSSQEEEMMLEQQQRM